MADQSLLDAVQSQQNQPSNQDVLDAVHTSQWSNTFNNTPSPEVLRNRLNLADVMNRAVTAKQDLAARTDLKALEIKQRTAQMEEFQRQAPMREQLLQAHIDATGATERRKAEEAISQANDTAGLNGDIAQAYRTGLKPGTPEFQDAVFSSIAQHPHADKAHVQSLHTLAGGPDDQDPVAFAKAGIAYKQALTDAGFTNPRVKFVNGRWSGEETPVVKTDADRLNFEKQKAQAIQDIHNSGKTVQSPDEKIAATENLIINRPVSMAFGHLDAQGKLVPDTAGGKATHVNVSFVGPSGKIHDSGPITIPEYEALKARVNGATKAVGPAAPVAAPGAPVSASEADSPSSHTPSQPAWPDALTVKDAYKAGKLSRDDAAEILRAQFGHQ